MSRRLAVAHAVASLVLAAGLFWATLGARAESEPPQPPKQPEKPIVPPGVAPGSEDRRPPQERTRERAVEKAERRATASAPTSQPGIQVGPLRLIKVVAPPDPTAVTDEQIGAAIERGAEYLMSLFQNGELTVPNNMPAAPRMGNLTGPDCLAVYALMQCGLATKIEKLDIKNAYLISLIERMKALPVEERVATYTHGIRATALSLYNRPEDRHVLEADLTWLLQATDGGHYTYVMPPGRAKVPLGVKYNPGNGASGYDNSNSQYGLLGVWSAAEAGAEIPSNYWSAVEKHWSDSQLFDGMWPYSGRAANGPQRGTLTMTLAGVASMFVTQDYLYGQKLSVGREPFTPPLQKALTWLETGNNCQFVAGYGGYALERVGLASGFKYFGVHDWYREGARHLIVTQQADGSWGREGPTGPVNTAYNLLFLARGRHPILYNKLRFDHFWANRPRDVANLAKFANKELEHPFNWQVVSVDRDWTDWLESPVLYLASHEAAKLKDVDYEKIRNFINAGGLLFTQADAGSAAFNKYVETLASKVCPSYELGKIPPDHEIYKVLYKLDAKKLQLKGVTNGARLLMVHSPLDVSQFWQLQASTSHATEYQFGLNLFVYAAGKSDFANRISGTYVPPVPPRSLPAKPGGVVKLLRVKYGGNWDPEPGAWRRFARKFQWQTSCVVDVDPVDAENLVFSPDKNVVQVAHLTGTVAFNLSEVQVTALRAFVEAGGMLFVDACGSSPLFNDAVTSKVLPQIFPNSSLERISESHPIFGTRLPGSEDLHKPVLRPYATAKLGNAANVARLEGFTFGKGHVVYSWIDVASGLLGNRTFGVIGYEPTYALGLLNNLVLWTAAGQPETIALPATMPATRPATLSTTRPTTLPAAN